MTAKEELWQVRRARARVLRLEMEIAELESILEGCTSYADGMPKASGVTDRLGSQVARLVALKDELAAEVDIFLLERRKAVDVISGIKNDSFQDVLIYRYVLGLDWQAVAKKMSYSIDHTYKLHGWALGAYEKVSELMKDNSQ